MFFFSPWRALVSVASTSRLHYFLNPLVFVCGSTSFLTHFCGSFCPSLSLLFPHPLPSFLFLPHLIFLLPGLVYSLSFFIHCLHSFSLPPLSLLIFPSYLRILFFPSICLSSTAFYYSSLFPLLSIALRHIFIPLSQHHMCHGGKHREQRSLLNNYHAKQSK